MVKQKEDKVNWWIFISILLFSSVVYFYFRFSSEITQLKQDVNSQFKKQSKALESNRENNILIMQKVYDEESKRIEFLGSVRQTNTTKETLVNR